MGFCGRLRSLHSGPFLRELHHLLWTAPSTHGELNDGGWNCRDHAWVAALLGLSMQREAVLVSGRAFFARGADAQGPDASFTVIPHSWACIAGFGAVDLSIKHVHRIEDREVRLPIHCILHGEIIPRGRGTVHYLAGDYEYARAGETLPRRPGEVTAAYLAEAMERPTADYLKYAAGWIGSDLTCRLDDSYGNPSDLYCALFLHLKRFLEGTRRSLTSLSFVEAWRRLAAERDGAIDRALEHLGGALDDPTMGAATAKSAVPAP